MHESRTFKIFRVILLTGLTLFSVLPLYTMISTSVKPLADVQKAFSWIPTNITIQPYIDMWATVPLARYFVNSLIVSSTSSTLSVLVALITGYVLSRFAFRGRGRRSGTARI